MALEDIENLKARLAENPDSKLFVPLSEEYRKAEMFDEAIEVLKQGLELQPSYMSARVALGKIYLEKEMREEAKSEFEEVIKTIPDNLFAHKKLAEIYRGLDNPVMAIQQYETVLKLNPLDDEASEAIEALSGAAEAAKASEEAGVEEESPAEELPASVEEQSPVREESIDEPVKNTETEEQTSFKEPPAIEEEVVAEEELAEATHMTEEGGEVKEEELGDEFTAFRSAMQSDGKPSDVPSGDVSSASSKAESDEPPMFYPGESTAGSSREDFELRNKEHILPDDEEFLGRAETQEEEKSEIRSDLDRIKEFVGEPITVEEGENGIQAQPGKAAEITGEPGGKVDSKSDFEEELHRAEELVKKEKFEDAVKYFNELAEKYPDEKRITQKLQELNAYLKMLGNESEGVINRLEQFLNGIKLMKERR